ncbi:MAG: hypothetical protein ACO3NW_11270, partial [Kiritimatiellia bacterium]
EFRASIRHFPRLVAPLTPQKPRFAATTRKAISYPWVHFRQVAGVLQTECPDLLSFGEVYELMNTPLEILEAAAEVVDVISLQIGPGTGTFPGPGYEREWPGERIAKIMSLTGKPVYLADHAVSFPDPSGDPTLWHLCADREEAEDVMAHFRERAEAIPGIIGYARCTFRSRFFPERGILKQGILDLEGRPYGRIPEIPPIPAPPSSHSGLAP